MPRLRWVTILGFLQAAQRSHAGRKVPFARIVENYLIVFSGDNQTVCSDDIVMGQVGALVVK